MKKMIMFAIPLALIMNIGIYLNFVKGQDRATEPKKENVFVITKIDNNEYFGKSVTDNEIGIYFTNEYIDGQEIIKEGDTVKATFENEYDDSLLSIQKDNEILY